MKPAAANTLSKLAAKKSLLSLDLKYNDLGPKGAAKLFSKPESWKRLRVLDISANEIGDVGTQAIAAASLPELRWLNISSNAQKEQLTEKSAIALASSQMPNLYSLNLFGHPIKSRGVAALLEAKGLRGLRELNVGYCSWSIPELMESLGQGEPVAIERLDLKSPSRPGGPADWSKATFMKTVKTLNIETIDAKGIEDLFRCPHLENLEILVLGCSYGDETEALEAISKASLPGLKYLGLNGYKLNGQSAKKLAKSPLFRELWGVELMPTYTQPEAWRAFYDEGIPLVGYVHFDGNPANEYGSLSPWRDEI
jgi:hypothetical protein